MGADGVENRMHTSRVEVGADSEYIQRVLQECFLQTFPVLVEETHVTVRSFVTDGNVFAALIGELGGKNIASPNKFAVQILLFIHDAEFVALTRILQEVDHAAEDVSHAHDYAGRDVCTLASQEQAVSNTSLAHNVGYVSCSLDGLNFVACI